MQNVWLLDFSHANFVLFLLTAQTPNIKKAQWKIHLITLQFERNVVNEKKESGKKINRNILAYSLDNIQFLQRGE